MSNDTLGILFACLCCLVPWSIGFLMAWVLRLRVAANGWRGALVPQWLRARWDNLMVRIQEEE